MSSNNITNSSNKKKVKNISNRPGINTLSTNSNKTISKKIDRKSRNNLSIKKIKNRNKMVLNHLKK